MASNEDYLDRLLQDAIEKENQMEDSVNENIESLSMPSIDSDPNRSLSPEEIEAMFAASLNLEISDDKAEDNPTEDNISEDNILEDNISEDNISQEIINDMDLSEELPDSVSTEFDSVLDDLLDTNESMSFDSELADMADFSEIESSELADMADFSETESFDLTDVSQTDDVGLANSTEEMEIDLDTVDDIDSLLGLKEMPSDYKEGRKKVVHPEDANVEGEDIDLLNALSELDEEIETDESDDLENQELSDILDMLGNDDSELAEINDILKKSENNELIDASMGDLDGENDENEGEPLDLSISAEDGSDDLAASETKESKKERRKKEKEQKKKEKAEKKATKSEGEEQAKGFFGKLLEVLTTEVEEEEEASADGANPEGDAEQAAPKEKGKKKKGKGKGKKGKGKGSVSNDEIMDEMDAEDAKGKEKPKKKPKPKKEKKVKEPEVIEPGKKLPKKMVISIFVLCFSIFAVIYLVNTFIPKALTLKSARKAYFNGDYQTAFEKMAGFELNENDQLIYDKVTILTKLDQKLKLYEAYNKAGEKSSALNALIEAVDYYNQKSDKIDLYGIRAEATNIYNQAVNLLLSEYSLDINSVNELINSDKVTYTKKLKFITGESTENVEELVPSDSQNSEKTELEDPLEGEFDL